MCVFSYFALSLTCLFVGYRSFATGSYQHRYGSDDYPGQPSFGREKMFPPDRKDFAMYGWTTTAKAGLTNKNTNVQHQLTGAFFDDDDTPMGYWTTKRSTTNRPFLYFDFTRATTKRPFDEQRSKSSSSSEEHEIATGLGPRFGTTHKPQFPADPFNGGENKLEKTSQEKKRASKATQWCKRYTEECSSFKSEVALGLKPRIIGGRAATPKKRKFMVLVGFGNRNNREWLCGGSLISSRFVLTAAHCTDATMLGKAKWARVGELDLSSRTDDAQPRDYEIIERIRHPDYKEPAVYNDIALLKLSSDVVFNEWVQPICLHTSVPSSSNEVTVTGWGRTEFASKTSPMLLEVEVRLFNDSECVRLMGLTPDRSSLPRGIDTGSMICAGDINGGRDACTGDSGGPLFLEEDDCVTRQLGITSLGKDCGLPGTAGVYTNVPKYIQWIESIVWNSEE